MSSVPCGTGNRADGIDASTFVASTFDIYARDLAQPRQDDVLRLPTRYSIRNDSAGSMCDARRAGIHAANAATSASTAIAAASTPGSLGEIWKSIVESTRRVAQKIVNPTSMPAP